MHIYESYLVNHSHEKNAEKSIHITTFSLFLSNFVKGTLEDRVNLYSEFLQIENESIPIENIIEVSRQNIITDSIVLSLEIDLESMQ